VGSLIGCSLSWAAFHAEQDSRLMPLSAISALLPLFQHAPNTPAMMQHSMMVIKAAVKMLNHSQTPVITVDQPLYALMKQLQWAREAWGRYICNFARWFAYRNDGSSAHSGSLALWVRLDSVLSLSWCGYIWRCRLFYN